jgi:hypothetical protein
MQRPVSHGGVAYTVTALDLNAAGRNLFLITGK